MLLFFSKNSMENINNKIKYNIREHKKIIKKFRKKIKIQTKCIGNQQKGQQLFYSIFKRRKSERNLI